MLLDSFSGSRRSVRHRASGIWSLEREYVVVAAARHLASFSRIVSNGVSQLLLDELPDRLSKRHPR
jgi:hypothetical protein